MLVVLCRVVVEGIVLAPPSQSCGVSGEGNSAKLVLRRKRKSRNDKVSSGNSSISEARQIADGGIDVCCKIEE